MVLRVIMLEGNAWLTKLWIFYEFNAAASALKLRTEREYKAREVWGLKADYLSKAQLGMAHIFAPNRAIHSLISVTHR